MKPGWKRRVNKELQRLSRKYWEAIPLDEINQALKLEGTWLVQEDGTPWEGFLMGSSSAATIELHGMTDCTLQVQWYRMQSGNWEINCYVS